MNTVPSSLSKREDLISSSGLEIFRAMDAERAGNWKYATEIWSRLRLQGVDDRVTAVGMARCLRSQNMLDEADEILREQLMKLPEDTELLAEYALVAKVRHDVPECARRWHTFYATHPDCFAFASEAALTYSENGDPQAGADLLRRAEVQSPADPAILIPKAMISEKLSDWKEAARCWGIIRALMPDDAGIKGLWGRAVWHASLEEESVAESEEPAPKKDEDLSEIASIFESMGDNCELGLVQRALGAEPIGLYRFAAVRPETMLELLLDRFAPLGDPAHTHIDEREEEYIALDDRGYFWIHTMVTKNEMTAEKLLKQQLSRISILRRRMLASLEGGGKIFVMKDSSERISDAMLHDLSEQIELYSKSMVLGIRMADDAHKPGSVEYLADNIAVGYLGQMFSSKTGIGPDDIDMTSWKSVLKQVFHHAVEKNLVPAMG